MDEARAREILGKGVDEDNSLTCSYPYTRWSPGKWQGEAVLDGDFTLEQVEAIAWWMRNKGAAKCDAG